jgi:hypothetical protein
MQRLKMLGLTMLVVFALAAVAVSSASALPTVTALPGETAGNIIATTSATGANIAELSTALSAPITSEKVKLETSFASGASLGTYVADFFGVTFEKQQCNTPGDADGVVLASGEAHLVVAVLGASLVPAILLDLPGTLEIDCGPLGKPTLTIKITGGTLGKISVKNGEEITSFKGALKCTKANNGKQELKEFINDEGAKVKRILSANLGLGAESGCEEVKEEVTLALNKMATFAGF